MLVIVLWVLGVLAAIAILSLFALVVPAIGAFMLKRSESQKQKRQHA